VHTCTLISYSSDEYFIYCMCICCACSTALHLFLLYVYTTYLSAYSHVNCILFVVTLK
jgi:hypothetical protein